MVYFISYRLRQSASGYNSFSARKEAVKQISLKHFPLLKFPTDYGEASASCVAMISWERIPIRSIWRSR